MADIFEDFQSYFAGKGLLDVPMFFDTFLDDPDTAVAVFEYSGSSGPQGVIGVLRSFQVVVRAKAVKDAKTRCGELYSSLVTKNGIINLTDERWAQITLRQPPFKMKVDDRNRVYYCFNLGLNTYYD